MTCPIHWYVKLTFQEIELCNYSAVADALLNAMSADCVTVSLAVPFMYVGW